MAKTDSIKRSKRRSKAAAKDVVEEEGDVKTEGQTETVEDAPKVDQDEQDSQMDADIEIKGNVSTVSVSWEEKNKEGELHDAEKGTDASDQMMDREEQTISPDAVDSTEDVPSESAEMTMKEELQEEPQEDTVVGSAAAVTVTWEENDKENESDDVQKEITGDEQVVVEKKPVEGKRKARTATETPPPKKTKLINDGYCLYVGNLDNSKSFDEVKDSLATFFMKQSILVQDIRLDRSKKHAFVDLASQLDLTKGLALNGEVLQEKPMKIAKAKVKTEEEKVKPPPKDKKGNKTKSSSDSRCLFLKNVPYNATEQDIQKVFSKAVSVRFPGGTKGPTKGIAFVEFENKEIAMKALKQKQGVKIQDRILIVDCVGKSDTPKVDNKKDDVKAAAPANTTLYVSKLPFNIKETDIKKIFEKAVGISIPKSHGKSKGFAFVEFAGVEDAELALQSSKKMKHFKKALRVEFCKKQMSAHAKVLTKTLIVMGLSPKTSAETLKSAFDGAASARVNIDKVTGLSRKFGFVDFESEDDCKAAKEAMEDCEIDGSKVTVAFAKESGAKPPVAPGKQCGNETPQEAVKEVENKG